VLEKKEAWEVLVPKGLPDQMEFADFLGLKVLMVKKDKKVLKDLLALLE